VTVQRVPGQTPQPVVPAGPANPENAWIWAALPEDCERVEVHGDPELSTLLSMAGFQLAADGQAETMPPDVVVLSGPGLIPRAELRRIAAQLAAGGILVVASGGTGGDVDRWTRLRLLSERVAVRPTFEAVRMRLILPTGLQVWAIGRRGLAPSGRAILIAGRVQRPTVAERAVRVVEEALGTALRATHTKMLSTDILVSELETPMGQRYLLRLAAGAGAALLSYSSEIQQSLVAAGAGPAVTDRLVPTLVAGNLRGLRYSVEPRVDGHHRRTLTGPLFEDCLDFLSALSAVPRLGDRDAAQLIRSDIATLTPHADARRAVLERAGAELAARLAEVTPVWCHGDFWPGNFLLRDGRLVAVLDWDAATPQGLPLTDVLHLIALGDRRVRRLPHGRRCAERLWPLARAGNDARIRRYCERTGTAAEPRTLEALAVAYWLGRVARDLRTFGDRTARTTWMDVNFHGPLAALERAGW
jgi:aminoglycoside phosphotransferase (APT) family kinase protein